MIIRVILDIILFVRGENNMPMLNKQINNPFKLVAYAFCEEIDS